MLSSPSSTSLPCTWLQTYRSAAFGVELLSPRTLLVFTDPNLDRIGTACLIPFRQSLVNSFLDLQHQAENLAQTRFRRICHGVGGHFLLIDCGRSPAFLCSPLGFRYNWIWICPLFPSAFLSSPTSGVVVKSMDPKISLSDFSTHSVCDYW